MARAVLDRWREPDHGIWEIRLDRRHHVHSKAMCWQTLQGALAVEEAVTGTRNAEWGAARDEIRAEVLDRGWNPSVGAFTAAYGSDDLDAACLAVGLTGLLDRRDPRWAATVEAVSAKLRRGGTVRRYLADDGLAGPEGGMHLCTGWLAEAMFSLGRRQEGLELLSGLAQAADPLGLLTEQQDPETGMALGNIAQAYSHLALINAALAADAGTDAPGS
jgi:GH15 family glucan-1,4-alpha-glucosidase